MDIMENNRKKNNCPRKEVKYIFIPKMKSIKYISEIRYLNLNLKCNNGKDILSVFTFLKLH